MIFLGGQKASQRPHFAEQSIVGYTFVLAVSSTMLFRPKICLRLSPWFESLTTARKSFYNHINHLLRRNKLCCVCFRTVVPKQPFAAVSPLPKNLFTKDFREPCMSKGHKKAADISYRRLRYLLLSCRHSRLDYVINYTSFAVWICENGSPVELP